MSGRQKEYRLSRPRIKWRIEAKRMYSSIAVQQVK
jgi:hypothetical protein